MRLALQNGKLPDNAIQTDSLADIELKKESKINGFGVGVRVQMPTAIIYPIIYGK